jgi:hypothetical protein
MTETYTRLRAAGFEAAILWLLLGNIRAARFYEGDGWRTDGSSRQERMWDVPVEMIRYRRELG